ncbi:MAG: endolytic transglycosylase MltG [Methylococcales bacterium]
MHYKIIGFTLLVLSFVGGWLALDYQDSLNKTAVTGNSVTIEIAKGDSLSKIADKLIAQQVVIKPLWFKAFAFHENIANKLKAGEYELAAGLTVPQILDLLAEGKTKQYSITFPEGRCLKDILHDIANNPHLEHTLTNLNTDALKSGLKVSMPSFEGLFFPDTYFFEKHMTDVSLLKRAYDKMQAVLADEWLHKSEGLPFKSAYEALTLASIVEKETAAVNERPLIAGVFIRRLEKDMLLQTDPTVIYGMGDAYKGDIRYKDLQQLTPYNTYMVKGLPPTPISMPGREAINAVLHPNKSNSLYFVAKGDGTHVFSESLRDHNQAVDNFQKKKHD